VAGLSSKISGPLFDRIDLHIDVPAVTAADLSLSLSWSRKVPFDLNRPRHRHRASEIEHDKARNGVRYTPSASLILEK
jgi:predicted ATPase with chaperone activity